MIIDDIVAAFAEVEGWWNLDPTVIPRRANNPMDLIFEYQNGATISSEYGSNPRTFAVWPTPQGGIVGAYRQVLAWTSLDLTLTQMIVHQDPGNPTYLSSMKSLLPHIDFDAQIKTLIPPLIRPGGPEGSV